LGHVHKVYILAPQRGNQSRPTLFFALLNNLIKQKENNLIKQKANNLIKLKANNLIKQKANNLIKQRKVLAVTDF
jgi:hypothetical protein